MGEALSFALIFLLLLRFLESDCPNYYNKTVTIPVSINVWGHNRHEKVLDPFVLSSVCLIPVILWSDTLVGLLYTPCANGPKSVLLNDLVFELCTMLPISQSFLLNIFPTYIY